jgi:uncharacterized membrane protein (DUF106 family)
MPDVLSNVATEVGIGATAITAIIYLVTYLRNSHTKEMEEMRTERKELHTSFMSYVETNNHQRTEMIKEATTAMVEAREAISLHTQLLREHINNIKK